MKIKPQLALSLIALAVWAVLMGRQEDFGPGFIPFLLGIVGVLLGLVVVLRWLKSRGMMNSMPGMALAIALTFGALAGLMQLLKLGRAPVADTPAVSAPSPEPAASERVPR